MRSIMASRKASCWFVVSYYAGDRPGPSRPRGSVRGVHGKAAAMKEAAAIQKRLGGQKANVIVEAFSCERAPKLFDLKA